MSQQIVILGAGTALPDHDRDNTSLVWSSPAGSWLIDCGGRAYQQLLRAGIDPKSLRGAILTHNHADHIYGLPALLFHLWLGGYEDTFGIYANAPTLGMAQRLVAALELEENGHMCKAAWHELPEAADHLVIETDSYAIRTSPVRHSRPTLGLRIADRDTGRDIAYTSDTEPCPEVDRLAQGAHTLIHEAAAKSPDEGHGHTTPRQVGETAAKAGVERVVLIHYSAAYVMPEEQAISEVRAGGFEGDVRIARELESYSAGDR
jgi:ribonuclease Z